MDYTQHYLNAKSIVDGIRSGRLQRTPTTRPEPRPAGFMNRDLKEDMAKSEKGLPDLLIDEMLGLQSMLDSIPSESVNGLSTRELLAKTLQAEAGGEGYEGMLAAGATIANRAQSGRYGEGIDGVILKPGQFSAWNKVTGYANGEGGLDVLSLTPSEDSYAVADAILGGNYDDPTGGATHYYNDSVVEPRWGANSGGDWRKIGNHLFGNPDGRRQQ